MLHNLRYGGSIIASRLQCNSSNNMTLNHTINTIAIKFYIELFSPNAIYTYMYLLLRKTTFILCTCHTVLNLIERKLFIFFWRIGHWHCILRLYE